MFSALCFGMVAELGGSFRIFGTAHRLSLDRIGSWTLIMTLKLYGGTAFGVRTQQLRSHIGSIYSPL